jgi:hypothetical protein
MNGERQGELLAMRILLKQVLERHLSHTANPRKAAMEMRDEAFQTLESAHGPLNVGDSDPVTLNGARKTIQSLYNTLRLEDSR